jgi:hypothetical protein
MKVQAVFWIADGKPHCLVDTLSRSHVREWYETLVKVFPGASPVLTEIEITEPKERDDE